MEIAHLHRTAVPGTAHQGRLGAVQVSFAALLATLALAAGASVTLKRKCPVRGPLAEGNEIRIIIPRTGVSRFGKGNKKPPYSGFSLCPVRSLLAEGNEILIIFPRTGDL